MKIEEEKKIAIFAGTTEGRLLAMRLTGSDVRADVFVATEYGKEEIPPAGNLHVHDGRLDEIEMEDLFRKKRYDLILDATHPFAKVVTANIREAAKKTGTMFLRILRERDQKEVQVLSMEDMKKMETAERNRGIVGEAKAQKTASGYEDPDRKHSGDELVFVDTIRTAVEFLKMTKGSVFVTTGSKELSAFLELPDWENRVYARVLSMPEVVKTCAGLGFYGSHLIAMQGPFSEELNVAMMRSVHAKWMVTKESGKAGGFEEKVSAAKKAGVGLVVIGRPAEEGISLDEGIRYLEEHFNLKPTDGKAGDDPGQHEPENGSRGKRQVFLIGTGPGDESWLTGEAKKCLEACDLVVGASRCVRQLHAFQKPVFEAYQPSKIADYLDTHPELKVICGAMSGDTGFYSAAEKLSAELVARGSYEVQIIPGISSVGYFFAKIGRSWDHVRLFSMHGKEANFASELKRCGRAFVLGGGADFYGEIYDQLVSLDMQEARIFTGENLSLAEEKIDSGTAEILKDRKAPPLAVLYAEWDGSFRPLSHGLPDEAFIRGNVPMTKMEVRTVSVAKLEITENSVLYDVGAGTGSVSVECAGLSDSVSVYAIEKNPEAVSLLYENRKKYALTNITVVDGTAPEALNGLPAPTHVFIGGSGGKMEEVISLCLQKNPETRFVINLITPESLAAVLSAAKALPVTEPELVTLTAARSKKAGNSHLMMGQNPVWIVSFTGKKD